MCLNKTLVKALRKVLLSSATIRSAFENGKPYHNVHCSSIRSDRSCHVAFVVLDAPAPAAAASRIQIITGIAKLCS